MSAEIHLYLPQMRMSHEAIVERARVAEAARFDGIAFMDHLAPPLAADQEMWDAMAIAGWVLAKTTSLTAGHLVLCDGFRQPAVLAREVTSLDHASGGRFELGIGWGSLPEEFATFGIAPIEPAERVNRLGETLEILRALWSGEVVDYEGDHHRLAGAQQRPVPTRRIPITIGGVGRRTLALVRAHADWWNVPVHELERLDALRQQAGEARVSIQLRVAQVADDGERDQVLALDRRRYGEDSVMHRGLVVGTTAELTEHVARLHAQGVERCYLWFADFGRVESLQRFGEVIDGVAAATG
jgi:alkanesulfonate monooxygenase SsuD/methylene tetrahydromethanopterin reductase-like flavin-dependent oxidoreductase (luciferase family)